MKKQPRRETWPAATLALIVVLAPSSMAIRAAEETPRAGEILEQTGVDGGLVVHLGCGDGRLTAALRANDRLVVHGLGRDAANVQRAREHLQSQGLYGPVSVDLHF